MVVPLPLLLLGVVVFLLVVFLRRNYGSLENCGFPVIPPTLFCGSGPFLFHNINMIKLDQDRFESYGTTYGAYMLSTPWVYTSDPKIIKQITVKDFDSFRSRPFVFPNQKYRSLDTAEGEEWVQLRKGLSPIFTSGKIKGMMRHVDGVVDNMLNHLDQRVKEDPVVDMKPVFQYLTMDVISKCAFGVDLNCFTELNNPMLKNSMESVVDFMAHNLKSSLLLNLMFGMLGIENYLDLTPATRENLWNITRRIQEKRAKENRVHGDFIDTLAELTKREEGAAVTADQWTSQGIIFLLAGFETSATTLGSLAYYLVSNTDVYQTLMDEVDKKLEEFKGEVNHETITEMHYLDACLKETLRMLPPVTRNDRMCYKDWTFNNITIKKGTRIGIPTYIVHHNPDFWPEPELFKPERFLKENAGNIVPCSYLPFGSGPRACIGERFAMIEMKITMVRLLQKFHIEKHEKTKQKLLNGSLFLSTYKDSFVKLVERK